MADMFTIPKRLSGLYCCFWKTHQISSLLAMEALMDFLLTFCCRHNTMLRCVAFFAYLNGADSSTKLQLIVFAFDRYEQFQKYILKKKIIIIIIIIIAKNINVSSSMVVTSVHSSAMMLMLAPLWQ